MVKKILLTVLVLLWFIFNQQIKVLPIVGGFLGFLEFLLLLFVLLYWLYRLVVTLYLWLKVML